MARWIIGYMCWIAIASVISYSFYAVDKWRAVKGHSKNRIAENTLHLIDLFGGWPGGWLAQSRLRHKTQKLSFRVVFWITVALNVTLSVLIAWGLKT